MTEPTSVTGPAGDNNSGFNSAGAPLKKLKLTLKLNSSLSSSTASSILASSTTASPIKASEPALSPSVPIITDISDLPSGLGNVKGRGRPKKTAATKTAPFSISTIPEDATTKESTKETNSEYSADLKSFVTVMKTFQPRKWSLKRPITLEMKNFGGHEIALPNGLWCTFSDELGSAHLATAFTTSPNNTNTTSLSSQEESFEASCHCGKAFNDRSKYRKHVRTHEKAKNGNREETVDIVDNTVDNTNNAGITTTPKSTPTPTVPMISLRLTLKPQ